MILQKSNPKSFFLKLQHESRLAYDLFSKNPIYEGQKVIVLQINRMIDNWFILEIVNAIDYIIE